MKPKDRYPPRRKRPDGSWGCRGCGGIIPKNRQTWCSSLCYQRYEPVAVRAACLKRDKGICQLCFTDIEVAKTIWNEARPEGTYWGSLIYKRWSDAEPKIEYDHIVPFSEGGITELGNMRTLCYECHKGVTKVWRQRRRNRHYRTTIRPAVMLVTFLHSEEEKALRRRGGKI